MDKKVIVTGSLAFDYIMDFPGNFADHIDTSKIHALSVSFLVDTLKKKQGGTAGNIAYTLSLLGLSPIILGAVGEDFKEYEAFLRRQGLDTSAIKTIKDESTATVMIMTDKKDNQISAFYPGAMKSADRLSIKDFPNPADFVVISPNLPRAMAKFVSECKKGNIPYLYDPGMQLPRISDGEILDGVSGAQILVGNDYEMGIIKKRLKLTDDDLLGSVKILIATLGEKGSIIQTKKEKKEIAPAKPKEVLDPTGAGDGFRAGFLAGFLKGFDLEVCGRMGSTAASYIIEKYGTTSHKFTLKEFEERYEENYNEKISLS